MAYLKETAIENVMVFLGTIEIVGMKMLTENE